MNINWKVRLKNKTFWLTMVPAILLLVKQICDIAGVTVDFSVLQEQLIGVISTVFVVLAILGIVTDHTTEGLSDSQQALTYDEPKGDE